MSKYLFAILVLFHAFFHSLRFYDAFGIGPGQAPAWNIPISLGYLWITAAMLFMIMALGYLTGKSWFTLTIPTVLLSEFLIYTQWPEAKWGSAANIVILIVLIPAIATEKFTILSKRYVSILFGHPVEYAPVITNKMLEDLPAVVQRWLKISGVIGRNKVRFIHIEQDGMLRTKPDGKWMSFTAIECVTTERPGFVWQAEIYFKKWLPFLARDTSIGGSGTSEIRALGVFRLAKAENGIKLDTASMSRFLAEICWYPTAALNRHLSWEALDDQSAMCTMRYAGMVVTGTFRFSDSGDIQQFEMMRYMETDENAEPVPWIISMKAYDDRSGFRIPIRCSVTWQLEAGDFTWATITVKRVRYDRDVVPIS